MEKTIDFKRYMDQERQTINTDRVNTDKRRSNKDQSLPELLTDEESRDVLEQNQKYIGIALKTEEVHVEAYVSQLAKEVNHTTAPEN